jgi:hypothetical protein
VGDLELPEWRVVTVYVENLGGHLSHTVVGGGQRAEILFKNPLNKKILLLWSQSLLVLMSNRVRLVAEQACLQRRSWDAVRLAGLALTFVNTRIEIADSRLYSVLTRSHIESVVAVLLRVKVWGSRFGGVVENYIGRKVYGPA